MTVTPKTAQRTLRLIAYCQGDLNRASYECRLTLRSLGTFTDKNTSAVLAVVDRMTRLTSKQQAVWATKLQDIAATEIPDFKPLGR